MQWRLNAWECWAVAWGPHGHRGPMLIYVCCVGMFFSMFKHQYNKYMFNFINHLHIYSCVFVGRGSSALLCSRAYDGPVYMIGHLNCTTHQHQYTVYPSVYNSVPKGSIFSRLTYIDEDRLLIFQGV